MTLAKYHRFILVFAVLLSANSWVHGAAIMVNEYQNSNSSTTGGVKMTTNEFIEFVLTESMTVAQLTALTFGDSESSTSTLQGVFQFDAATLTSALAPSGLSAFMAGTIIVVKGTALGAQDLNYNPLANLGSDDAWNIQLVAGQGAKDHAETTINGNLAIANQGDVVWIASGVPASNTDTSGFISAIGHDSVPGAIANAVISQFGAGSIMLSTLGSPKAVYNTADSVVSLSSGNQGTMGTANGGTNSTWISGMRASIVPEPSRAFLIGLGLQMLILGRRRDPVKK